MGDTRQIRMGCFAPPLTEQIPGCSPRYDDLATCINKLRVAGILVSSEVDKANLRLIKKATQAAQAGEGE